MRQSKVSLPCLASPVFQTLTIFCPLHRSASVIDPFSRFLVAATGSSSRGWGAFPVPETNSIVTYHSIEPVF